MLTAGQIAVFQQCRKSFGACYCSISGHDQRLPINIVLPINEVNAS